MKVGAWCLRDVLTRLDADRLILKLEISSNHLFNISIKEKRLGRLIGL